MLAQALQAGERHSSLKSLKSDEDDDGGGGDDGLRLCASTPNLPSVKPEENCSAKRSRAEGSGSRDQGPAGGEGGGGRWGTPVHAHALQKT